MKLSIILVVLAGATLTTAIWDANFDCHTSRMPGLCCAHYHSKSGCLHKVKGCSWSGTSCSLTAEAPAPLNATQLVAPLSEASHKGTCAAADNKHDCKALLDFWRAMGSFTCDHTCQQNPPYGGKGFADGTALCGWYGITCDKRGRVSGLDFNSATKECPIPIPKYGDPGKELPNSLHLLNGLDTISLALGLGGTVPASLGSLPKLKYIFLSFNGLSGTVPNSLGALSNLEVLQLADNKLTGTVPDSFGNLTNLRQLRMDDNKITGFPNSICHLTSGYPDNGNLTDCMMGQNPLKYCPPCAKDRCDTFDDCPN